MSTAPVNRTDVAVIGGGVLGLCIAYWLSTLYDVSVTLLESEKELASVTTRRNTGVIHRPFYLDPVRKSTFAKSAQLSYYLWKDLARKNSLPWNEVGTIELAITEKDIPVLEKYAKWSAQNGMQEEEFRVMNGREIREIEPAISAVGGIYSVTDTSTDFQVLSGKLSDIIIENGVRVLTGCKVKSIRNNIGYNIISANQDGKAVTIAAGVVINAAGSSSLGIAHELGLGTEFSSLYFRGEYWKVNSEFGLKIRRNIYTIPQFREFPFLDPHLIVKHDGRREIGPNAVPVTGPSIYNGFYGRKSDIIRFILERPITPRLSLFINHKFLSLAMGEWRSSLGKRFMVNRVNKFIPGLRVDDVGGSGISGIRSSVIDRSGFVPEAVILTGDSSAHIVNYNSPGATGAPSFALHVISKLVEKGYFDGFREKKERGGIWAYDSASFD